MKINILTNNDNNGGAARAAFRLLKSLQENSLDVNMYVRNKYTDDPNVIGPSNNLIRLINMFRSPSNKIINNLIARENKNFHSNNILPSRMHRVINNCDIVNLHWLGSETLSIKDIGKINKPVVWTLHDMWPFCGSEHITSYDEYARWRTGYTKENRNNKDKGFDLDRYIWRKKLKHWKKPMHIITPSNWLANCAKESFLFKEWPVSVIPNPINTNIYKPLDKLYCKKILNISEDKKVILFGAIGGSKNKNKGFDLLLNSLNILHSDKNIDRKQVSCVIFGQSQQKDSNLIPFDNIWLGHVYDDITLSIIYNAADVMVVPSRIENFPQAATEAQACGIPVVGFNTSGVANAVIHNQTGYLAEKFDEESLANGIKKILINAKLSHELGKSAYERAQRLWSPSIVAQQYENVFSEIIKNEL